jgi:hypothetical protein
LDFHKIKSNSVQRIDRTSPKAVTLNSLEAWSKIT